MNELRMYVEHLFEGRALTKESIELKEEIYGNLVARYEDYVAGGMDEAEALEKTKASVPSIEEFAGVEDVAAADVDAAAGRSAAMVAEGAEPAEKPAAAAPEASAPKRSRGKIAAIVGGVLAAFILLALVWNFALEPALDRAEDAAETRAEQQWREEQRDAAPSTEPAAQADGSQGADSSATQDVASTTVPAPGREYLDQDEPLEYEASVALLDEVQGSPVEALQTAAAQGGDPAQLLAELPLGVNAASVSFAASDASTLNVSYEGISERYEGDAVDCAVAYNVAAVFATCPDVQTVSVSLRDEFDAAHDAERYVFQRKTFESGVAQMSTGVVTSLDSSVYSTPETWDNVRNTVMNQGFFDRQMELAEID